MSTPKEEKARQSRKFLISVMFMFLISIVVFVVGTYFFVIPRLVELKIDMAHLKTPPAVAAAETNPGTTP